MNRAILSGTLASDPELKTTQSGKKYVRSAIGFWRPSADKSKNVDFIPIIAWEHHAEFLSKYFKKNSKILVSGRLQNANYEKDGQTFKSDVVVVDAMEFIGKQRKENAD